MNKQFHSASKLLKSVAKLLLSLSKSIHQVHLNTDLKSASALQLLSMHLFQQESLQSSLKQNSQDQAMIGHRGSDKNIFARKQMIWTWLLMLLTRWKEWRGQPSGRCKCSQPEMIHSRRYLKFKQEEKAFKSFYRHICWNWRLWGWREAIGGAEKKGFLKSVFTHALEYVLLGSAINQIMDC